MQGLFGGPCFLWGSRQIARRVHRTIVYVDGFNFYYGALRGTAWKWLDLPLFFRNLLGPQNDVLAVKYFTARVQPTTRDPDVHVRQDTYFRALQAHCPSASIFFGHYLRHEVLMENANPPPNRVRVWKNEEKGSDVNLAVHALNDAWLDAYDCAVVVSNDSDLAESLRLIRSQHRKVVGVVTPGAPTRATSKQLRVCADFIRPIRTWMLRDSQLPNTIPGAGITKPASW